MKINLNFLHLKNRPIFEQLQIEEALLRLDSENWCIINEGSPPAIVMGISGKKEELINARKMEESPIPLIKRYSGGGTVIVDSNTLFVSFIFQKETFPFSSFPEPILRWSEEFYQKALSIEGFELKENDYVIGDVKCGGNAQYIKKDRFAHHTTFLWDFEDESMDYLLHPKKTPVYRNGRDHTHFLTRLKTHLTSKNEFINKIKEELENRYSLSENELNLLIPFLKKPHRKTTTFFIPKQKNEFYPF